MYKIKFSRASLCTGKTFQSTNCQGYTIWDLDKYPIKQLIQNIVDYCLPYDIGTHQYYPIMYWYVVVMSIAGLSFSTYEFVTVYKGHRDPSQFRRRHYDILPGFLRRNGRLLGAAWAIFLHASLLVGVLGMNTSYMTIWVYGQGLIFALEILSWFIDLLIGKTCIFPLCLTYILMTYSWVVTVGVRNVLDSVIECGSKKSGYTLF